MIEIRLFGNLRRHAPDAIPASDTILYLPAAETATVGQVLARIGIDPAEVSHVFLNGRLLPRAAYPITLGYPLAAGQPLTPEGHWGMPVREGDRVGIFPRNMGVVVV
ncbi:MAG TPA: hypothetical protein PKO09_11370 [Anaerolineae bacterium]|nr:hypothetical protein [Anaerolineae bacterium]